MLVDYHVHSLAHGEYSNTLEEIEAFLENAVSRGLSEIGFVEHERLLKYRKPDNFKIASLKYPQIKVRRGVEIDHSVFEEQELTRFIRQLGPLDFITGSVHCINGWQFDNQNMSEYERWISDLYNAYYRNLEKAVRNGFCDIVGHLDLIKVFNKKPDCPPDKLALPVLKAIKEMNLCVEINTNGYYKLAGEFYPSYPILEHCFNMNIPITLSSDAHSPDMAGRDINRAALLGKKCGYTRIATFQNRKRIMVNL